MLYHRFGASARIALIGHGTSLRLLFLHHLGLITSLHEQGDYQQVSWR
jgi:hypothetical protein